MQTIVVPGAGPLGLVESELFGFALVFPAAEVAGFPLPFDAVAGPVPIMSNERRRNSQPPTKEARQRTTDQSSKLLCVAGRSPIFAAL